MRIGVPLLAALSAFVSGTNLAAQDDRAAGGLAIELNSMEMAGGACRLTFMAENGFAGEIAELALETVMLTQDGKVERLTLFNFGALPEGRLRVRQFDLDGLDCDVLARVLINGVATCEGAEVTAQDCSGALSLQSRIEVELTG